MKQLNPVIAFVLLTACSSNEAEQKNKGPNAPARSVTVARVELRPLEGSLTASGILIPREQAAVSSEISGYRVAQVLVDEGDVVRAGQPLARLDPTLLDARLAQARAVVSEASARAAQSQGEAGRVAGLDGTGVLSDEQIANRRLQAISARASVASARAQLRDLEVQRSKMTILAPVSGVVLQRTVRPGDVSSSSGEPMFRVARDRLIELDSELPEDALDGLAPGTDAKVTLPTGATIRGHVRFVSPRVDPQTKLGRARISLPVDSRLRPGAYARAVLSRPNAPVAAVPEAAIQFEASGSTIVTIDADGRAHRVPVGTGARAGGWVALVTGPPVGTNVALGGGAFVLDGDHVRIAKER